MLIWAPFRWTTLPRGPSCFPAASAVVLLWAGGPAFPPYLNSEGSAAQVLEAPPGLSCDSMIPKISSSGKEAQRFPWPPGILSDECPLPCSVPPFAMTFLLFCPPLGFWGAGENMSLYFLLCWVAWNSLSVSVPVWKLAALAMLLGFQAPTRARYLL